MLSSIFSVISAILHLTTENTFLVIYLNENKNKILNFFHYIRLPQFDLLTEFWEYMKIKLYINFIFYLKHTSLKFWLTKVTGLNKINLIHEYKFYNVYC